MPIQEKSTVTIPMAKIHFASFNPATRTKRVEKLAASIAERGQLRPVSLVRFKDGTFHVADGHRTITALHSLGKTDVMALVYRPNAGEDEETVLSELFRDLNAATKGFNGRDKLNAAMRGGPVFDPNVKAALTQIKSLFPDRDGFEHVLENEITTTVLNVARKSTRYVLDSDIGEDTVTFHDRLRKHVLYLLRNDVQQAIIAYMRLNYDKKALRKAFDLNLPPPRTSSPKLRESWVKLPKSKKS